MQIEQIQVKNYGVLRNAKLTLPSPLTVIVGANGAGKSTLFDVFAFLKDALAGNVASAIARRGGFRQLVSRGEDGPISITIKFRESDGCLATYLLEVAHEQSRVVVAKEVLHYRKGRGRLWTFVNFSRGRGVSITNESSYGKAGVREERKDYELNDPRTLAIKGLGQFRTFPVVAEFRRLVEGWCICDSPARRTHSGLGYTEPHGSAEDNLAQAALHLHEHHPEQFDLVLQAMRAWVPGLDDVEVRRTEDGRSLLRFKDGSFSDPLAASSMSHGTIKLFAYLVLLHSPNPHSLLAITAPEKHLYQSLLGHLIEEFRAYARLGGQTLIATYSPEFLRGAEPDEVVWLAKADGFSEVRRADESGGEILRKDFDVGWGNWSCANPVAVA